MIKNKYSNPANYQSLPDPQGETSSAGYIFTSVANEKLDYDTKGVLRYPGNISALLQSPLDQFERHVLGIIGTYSYITTGMISDCLNLMGIPSDEDSVIKAAEHMRKTGLIHSFRFKDADTGETSTYMVHILTKAAGENALHSLCVPMEPLDNFNVVADPAIVKRNLAVNHIIIEYLKNMPIADMDKSKRFSVIDKSTREGVSARPSLTITFADGSRIFYEVVRKLDFWKTDLENKIIRYKRIQDNCDADNECPPIIFCCENAENAWEVYEMVSRIGLKAMFTHDQLLCGISFKSHIFNFNKNGSVNYYRMILD